MARLAGVDLPREKRLEIALTYIFGIGRTRAQQTADETGVSPDVRVRDLGEDDLVKLRDWIDANYKVEGDLRREIASDIRRKVEIGSYQGIRHRRGLPVHGQRTPHQRPDPQGPEEDRRRQEEAEEVVADRMPVTDHLSLEK
jgi:small subunit ribosomal protein S13